MWERGSPALALHLQKKYPGVVPAEGEDVEEVMGRRKWGDDRVESGNGEKIGESGNGERIGEPGNGERIGEVR
ncbi:hypothetical protein Pcinc_025101 [Petrolisthes cinctipes]|uniref:Uncharacterized protein n=1 Tax=Petrolisthes cinctipes TaxID=88211 RepID=A0AAE1KCH3_PETCI|nr:hypothetical protein Pcinc_025101 [Petrolisthes cinctipes]